jgi:hypothetical protein
MSLLQYQVPGELGPPKTGSTSIRYEHDHKPALDGTWQGAYNSLLGAWSSIMHCAHTDEVEASEPTCGSETKGVLD